MTIRMVKAGKMSLEDIADYAELSISGHNKIVSKLIHAVCIISYIIQNKIL